jgi:hypothetical protein
MQTSDQTQWRMAEVSATGLKYPPADTGGAPATYWVVKVASLRDRCRAFASPAQKGGRPQPLRMEDHGCTNQRD